MLRYTTETRPGLVALYDIRPGNGAGLFWQPRNRHGGGQRSGNWWFCVPESQSISYQWHGVNRLPTRTDCLRVSRMFAVAYGPAVWNRSFVRESLSNDHYHHLPSLRASSALRVHGATSFGGHCHLLNQNQNRNKNKKLGCSRVGHGSLFQNPTQPTISGPNPTHKSLHPTQLNPSSTLGMAY